jgi:hypothetical protein
MANAELWRRSKPMVEEGLPLSRRPTDGCSQVDLNVAGRVDHRAGRLAAAAEQIGDPDRGGVQQLAQDHRGSLHHVR